MPPENGGAIPVDQIGVMPWMIAVVRLGRILAVAM
jgi:hypothetical protein